MPFADVVLNHHLLYGHDIMTLVAWQGGGPLMRSGLVGTGQACCCQQNLPCCCKPDGTVVELAEGQECDGVRFSKPSASCVFDNITLTFTVCGLSATAPYNDWLQGIEPEFSAGAGSGNGNVAGIVCNKPDGSTFTANRFTFDTGGKGNSIYCVCNRAYIQGTVEFSLISDATGALSTCYLIWTVSECGESGVFVQDPDQPDTFCCAGACALSVTMNVAP